MDPHMIELPRIVMIGNRVLEKLPDVCKELEHEKDILILADSKTKGIAGDKSGAMLEGAGMTVATDTVAGSTEAEIGRLVEKHRPAIVIAAGGGTVIDVSKMVAYRRNVPFISVPTAPSHDGIASETASITGKDGKKHSIRAKPPIAIVADIGILKSAPYRLIASGSADAISNLTAVKDWRLAHKARGEYYSEYAASLSLLSSEIVIKSAGLIRKHNERGIRNLIEALISSGISMSLAGSSRPASGAEHAFSHALDSMGTGSLHGEQCGLGSILMSYHQGLEWERIRDALRAVGSPVTKDEIGISKQSIIDAVVGVREVRERYTIMNEKPLDAKGAEDLCRATGVC